MLELHWLKSLFHFATIFLAGLFAIFLFRQTEKVKSRAFYLGVFLVVIIINELGGFINHVPWLEQYFLDQLPWVLLLDNPFLVAAPPFLLFYVLHCLHSDFQFNKKHLVHFLPFAFLAIMFSVRLFRVDFSDWSTALAGRELLTRSEAIALHFLFQLQYCIYAIYGLYLIFQSGKLHLSSALPRLLVGLIAIKSVDLVEYSIYLFSGEISMINWTLYLIYQLAFLGLLALLFFDAISNVRNFVGNGFALKYDKTSLDPDRFKLLESELLELMDAKRPFLDPLLTLEKLARQLVVPSYHLSQVINTAFDQNFFEFINSYRIEESKKRLKRQKGSIEEIMYQSGFNSKSVFNTLFKKNTGLTPSHYRNNSHLK